MDGKPFNLACLKIITKKRVASIQESLYADDSTLVASDPKLIQGTVDCFSSVAKLLGLKNQCFKN